MSADDNTPERPTSNGGPKKPAPKGTPPETTLGDDARAFGEAAKKHLSPKKAAVDAAANALGVKPTLDAAKHAKEVVDAENEVTENAQNSDEPSATPAGETRPASQVRPRHPDPKSEKKGSPYAVEGDDSGGDGGEEDHPDAGTGGQESRRAKVVKAGREGTAKGADLLGKTVGAGNAGRFVRKSSSDGSIKGDVKEAIAGGRDGTKIGAAFGGVGAPVGAVIGAGVQAAKTKTGRRLLIAAVLVPPLAFMLFVLMIVTVLTPAVEGGAKTSDEGDAVEAAAASGVSYDAIGDYQEPAEESSVPWVVLAAIVQTQGGDHDTGAEEMNEDAAVEAVETNEEVGPYKILAEDAVKAADKHDVDLRVEGLSNLENASEFMAPLLDAYLDVAAAARSGNDVVDFSLDAGVVLSESDDYTQSDQMRFILGGDPSGQGLGLDQDDVDEDGDGDPANDGDHIALRDVYVEALSKLPIADAELNAEAIFDLAMYWHLGRYDCLPVAPVAETDQSSGTWSNPLVGYVTSPFGMRIHPVSGEYKLHDGTDVSAGPGDTDLGKPVHAASSGTVIVSNESWAGPHFVTIDHGNGVQTQYGHMSASSVKSGDTVNAGDQVGEVGAEGLSSDGAHLHFMVVKDGEPIDPEKYLESQGVTLAEDKPVDPATSTTVPASTTSTTASTSTNSDCTCPTVTPVAGEAEQVLVVSVDGLTPQALTQQEKSRFPNLNRLRQEGASTLNARTEIERTLTLPNHTGMLTGRPVTGPHGHGVEENSSISGTVQDQAGEEVNSVFTALNDAGLTSGLYAAKDKFKIFDRSWPELDTFEYDEDNKALTSAALADLSTGTDMVFLHLSLPDAAGHASGWMGEAYLRAVERSDALIGQAMAEVEDRPGTVMLLTADHGGAPGGHGETTDPRNYTVPFMAWGDGVPAGEDLYTVADRADPGTRQPSYSSEDQPIRNGDIANAAATLLGADPVDGSVFGADSPLVVTGDPTTVEARETSDGTTATPVSATSTAGLPQSWTGTASTGEQATLDRTQLGFAVEFVAQGREMNVSDDGIVIALMAVFPESMWRNYASVVYPETIGNEYPRGSIGSDSDSVGLVQQRPQSGWGEPMQLMDPTYAASAFYGGPDGPNGGSPMGLLDHIGWESRPKGEVAQDVQVSAYPDRYAAWEKAATELLGVVGGASSSVEEASCTSGLTDGFTVASFNILGWGHSEPGGSKASWPSGAVRFPKAMELLTSKGVSVAALQEMHPQNQKMFHARYGDRWRSCKGAQDFVAWDKSAWREVRCEGVKIPYFKGKRRPQPFVLLEQVSTGDKVWFMGIHNPASVHGYAGHWRKQALADERAAIESKKADGFPIFIAGDFNDGKDGQNNSECTFAPIGMQNAFGPSPGGCEPPKNAAPIDHIYSLGVTLADARVDRSPQAKKIADHPLVTAVIPSQSAGGNCEPAGVNPIADAGMYAPNAVKISDCLLGSFSEHISSIGGYRSNSISGNHERGCALDVMIKDWETSAGVAGGDKISDWIMDNRKEMGVQYVIWRQRIWSVPRYDEGWRALSDRGSPTANHMDHVHVSVHGSQCVVEV